MPLSLTRPYALEKLLLFSDLVAALKSVKDLKLGDFATGTPPPHAATSLKDALTKWAANDIGTMWALVPTIVRLKDHGIGTWSAVTNAKIDSVDLTDS